MMMASQVERYNIRAVEKEEIEVGDRCLYLAYNLSNNKRALAAAYRDEGYIVLRKFGSNYLIRLASDPTSKTITVHYNQIRAVTASDFHSEENTSRIAAENARHRIGVLLAHESDRQIP